MSRIHSKHLLDRANQLANDLVGASTAKNWSDARNVAEQLHQVGIASLRTLAPRGTPKFPAPCRLHGGEETVIALLSLLKSNAIPRDLLPAYFDALGTWAGEEAVEIVGHLLREGRGGEEQGLSARVLQHGFRALHLIGGPKAVELLTFWNNATAPLSARERAGWYLNQLSDRVVDPMFGSEGPEPGSAEEVKVQDSLWDPYRWDAAFLGVKQSLDSIRENRRISLDRVFDRIPRDDLGRSGTWWDPENWKPWEDRRIELLEALSLAVMIQLSELRLLVLDGADRLFPDSDVEERTECRIPFGWRGVRLRANSSSAAYLARLVVMRVPKGDDVWESSRSGDVRSVNLQAALRSWAVPLPGLAQECNRRNFRWPSLDLACLSDHVHEQMHWPHPSLEAMLPVWLNLPVGRPSGQE